MEEFKPRLTAPAVNNKCYVHYKKGGYNTCIVIDPKTGFVMPNCTGYAQGRLLELTKATKENWKLPAGNAEDWFETAKANGLSTGSTAKLGSVICWKSGQTKNSKDGAGHTAVVEQIKTNGDLVISESAYGKVLFNIRTVSKSNNYFYDNNKQFQGFIYCGVDFKSPAKEELKVGDTVVFTGNKHFTSSNGSTSKPCVSGPATITKIVGGAKHPYHCIRVTGGGSTVYGWVNKTDVRRP